MKKENTIQDNIKKSYVSCLEEINNYVDLFLKKTLTLKQCSRLSSLYIQQINAMSGILENEHNKHYIRQNFRDFIQKRIKWKEAQKEKLKNKKHKTRTWNY